MADTVFRSTTPQVTKSEPTTEAKTADTAGTTKVEVPFLDYQQEHSKPFLADHFELGDRWNDSEGGFPREIALIEGYLENRIKTGEMANSQSAVKEFMKSIEKLNNVSKEERSVVKIEILAHYVEFLMKNEKTKQNLKRYAY